MQCIRQVTAGDGTGGDLGHLPRENKFDGNSSKKSRKVELSDRVPDSIVWVGICFSMYTSDGTETMITKRYCKITCAKKFEKKTANTNCSIFGYGCEL